MFRKAARSQDRFFTVLRRENGNRRARLGLAISKKHCRHAVGRNRIKRVVREAFRLHQAELEGYDLVVLNRQGTHRAGNRELFDSLRGHWQRCCAAKNAAPEQS